MAQWAILSGIEGNLAAYEAVVADIKRQRIPVTELFILGDVIGLQGDNEAVVARLRSHAPEELEPQVCTGWWEEQALSLYGLRGLPDAPELMEHQGKGAVKQLWDSLSRETVQWLNSLSFGFFELDCLLIHGSTVSYDDELSPETPVMVICDRIMRANANNLFCGRAGQTFEYQLQSGSIHSSITTLDQAEDWEGQTLPPRRVIGVGCVGRPDQPPTYTLYNPGSNQVTFKTVVPTGVKGFGRSTVQPHR